MHDGGRKRTKRSLPCSWILCEGCRPNEAVITHQYAMSKVYLTYFSVDSSVNLTRFRYDITAHVDAVTDEAVVLSHERGVRKKDEPRSWNLFDRTTF